MANEPDRKKPAGEEEVGKKKAKTEKKAGGGRTVFWATLAGVIALNAVVAFFLVKLTMPKPEKVVDEEAVEDSTGILREEMEEIGFGEPSVEAVVNIKGDEGMHFLKVVLVFAYDKKRYKDLGDILKQRHPEFQSIVIERLSNRTVEELQRPTAKEEIRAELKRLVNKQILAGMAGRKDPGHVGDVYIKEFIIQ
jgi:flagellar basal body-associated protein FliL